MKTILFNRESIVFLLLLTLTMGCEINKAPTFHSIVPADNYTCEQGDIVNLHFGAEDSDGSVLKTTLYIDNEEVASNAEDFVQYNWNTIEYDSGIHEIKAIAEDDLGKKGEAFISITVKGIIVPTPTLTRIYPSSGKLYISWDLIWGINSYNLYWTDDGTDPDESSNKIEGIDDLGYNHEDLDYTLTYTYRVQATIGNMHGALSTPLSGSPEISVLESPGGLAVIENSGNAELTWNTVNADAASYGLKRKCIPEDGYFKTIAEDISVTSYKDLAAENGKGYFYKVYAEDIATSRRSEDSEPVYFVKKKEIYESEPNNADIQTTLTYNTHYYDADKRTDLLDWFSISGAYNGANSIYSSGFYKNYDSDCYLIDLEDGDEVSYTLEKGNMSGLWSMEVSVVEYGRYSTGGNREITCHSFSGSNESFSYIESSFGTVTGTYLRITMWEDLANTGPYNYRVGIKITRDSDN
jgi:hypothetical protein